MNFEPATPCAVALHAARWLPRSYRPRRSSRHRRYRTGWSPCAIVLPDGSALSVTGPLSLAGECRGAGGARRPGPCRRAGGDDVATAELLSAGLPPDPSISGGFAALLGGPASMSSLSAGFMEDVGAKTYLQGRQAAGGARRAGPDRRRHIVAGMAGRRAGGAARRGAGDHRATIASLRQDAAVLGPVDAAVRMQIAQSNQTLADGALAQAALATVQASLDSAEQAGPMTVTSSTRCSS